jgi:hypothetical protein
MKRKYGESLKARKVRLQVKEIKMEVILYNISRFLILFSLLIFFEVFYRANWWIIFEEYTVDCNFV